MYVAPPIIMAVINPIVTYNPVVNPDSSVTHYGSSEFGEHTWHTAAPAFENVFASHCVHCDYPAVE